MQKRREFLIVAAMAAGVMSASASAGIVVGYYTDFNPNAMGWAGPIAANGFTAVQVLDISIFDFSTVDIMVIDESSNGRISGDLLGRAADLDAYTLGGGKVVIHDRYVTDSSWIPGGGGMTLVRDFSFDTDLNVVTGGTQVTNGPFGTIDDATLDGGNSSNHGWALNLPGGATTFLVLGARRFPGWRAKLLPRLRVRVLFVDSPRLLPRGRWERSTGDRNGRDLCPQRPGLYGAGSGARRTGASGPGRDRRPSSSALGLIRRIARP